jgi:hypothetical protein
VVGDLLRTQRPAVERGFVEEALKFVVSLSLEGPTALNGT